MEHVQCSLFIYQPYGRSGVNMRHVAWNIHKHKYTITCVFVCLNIDSKQSHYWLIITPKIKLTWNGNRLSIVSCAVLYVEYICGLFENRSPNSFETDIITIPKYTVEMCNFYGWPKIELIFGRPNSCWIYPIRWLVEAATTKFKFVRNKTAENSFYMLIQSIISALKWQVIFALTHSRSHTHTFAKIFEIVLRWCKMSHQISAGRHNFLPLLFLSHLLSKTHTHRQRERKKFLLYVPT